ncbi:FAD-binding oxidoreductase [Candidatus Thorarchaeota archaeon]|nr:MAG: FAD-binding oxidoreductase [Candidatus Thorarchaeota archaeon]
MDSEVVKKLATIVGDEYISTRKDILLTYSNSASMSYDPVMPSAVIRPANTKEVSEIIKIANEHKIPVTPRSGGSSLQGEVIPKKDGLVIDLLRLEEIELHQELRSVTVGSGVNFGKLDKYLQQFDYWMPVYPGSSLTATIAGNVAVNGSGFGSSRFGCIGELVLGLEVVLPDGDIIQTGSSANPYAPGPFLRYAFGPDITGLFIGSLGSFGIITKVSLKIFKRMHYFDYNTYGFNLAQDAEKFIIELKENDVSAVWMAIYEGRILDFFLEMVGDEYGVPKYDWPPVTVSLVIGSIREDMLDSDKLMAESVCNQVGGHVIGIGELPFGEWNDRMRELARSSYVHGWHWRILYHHQTPSQWHRTLEELWPIFDEFGVLGHSAGFQSDHSSYNYYPQIFFDPQDKEDEERARAAHKELAKRLFKTGAVPFKLAPYWIDGISEMESYMQFIQQLKSGIDPNNILNPGVIPFIESER